MSFARTHIAFKHQLSIVLFMFAVITFVEIANSALDRSLNIHGILPRSSDHWYGVALAPLLHGSAAHYGGNIVPLMLFSFLVMQHGIIRYFLLTLTVTMIGGSLVWVFAREALHIGASGLLYGYFGFLLVAGFVSREFKLMLISAVVWFFYGGIVYGILPTVPQISFESHLFGFLVGAVFGYKWGGVAVNNRPKPGYPHIPR
ncbi:MAG: rhomboid family intramembrane serine protease [Pseudomonadales bacterium]|nr:rhomboid family intramembrane serine protease [Pseudomonadales bacterium]